MPHYTIGSLTDLACRALARAGANPDMARATAAALVAADAQGLASHGVSRVPQYATHLANSRADGGAVPAVVRAKGGAVLVDARCGLAFPACALAVATAIERARAEGLEVVNAVVLVDRQEGGLDNIRRHVADASGLITRDELLARWKEIRAASQ